jgi:hypothetical protein
MPKRLFNGIGQWSEEGYSISFEFEDIVKAFILKYSDVDIIDLEHCVSSAVTSQFIIRRIDLKRTISKIKKEE